MPDLALVAAGEVRVVQGIDHKQETFVSDEAIAPGQAFRINPTNGRATLANGTVAGEAGVRYVCVGRARAAGQPVTGVREGLLEGFNLDALAYDAPVYLSNTDGALADAAGTVSVQVGRVFPVAIHGLGSPADKLLMVKI